MTTSPARFTAECATLATLVRAAYIQYADGKLPSFISPRVMQQELKGSPSWFNSDRFSLEATAPGPQPRGVLMGPMLQALLEEKFHLRIDRETREVPIYELRVAKGGPKFKPAKPGSCVVFDPQHPPPEPGPGTPLCGGFWGDAMNGTTMENLARQLTATLDRDVTDQTGLDGTFDLHFEWPPDDGVAAAPDTGAGAPPADPAAGRNRLAANLEYAIPRLGLVLQPAKGSGKFLVIEHVEKPEVN